MRPSLNFLNCTIRSFFREHSKELTEPRLKNTALEREIVFDLLEG